MLSLRCLWSSYLMRCFIIGCSISVVHNPTNSTLKQAETLSILSHKPRISCFCDNLVQSRWNVMAHGDARKGKWRGTWRMECVASTLHTTLEHDVPSFTTADAHNSAASSRGNWRPRRFKWTRPFRWKTKCGFCACAITFQMQSTKNMLTHSNQL